MDLSDDNNNTITFVIDPQDALGASEVRTHLLKFEGGNGGPPATELFFDTTGPDEQTISLDFPAGLGTFTTIVIFADSGVGNTATGTYWIDDIAGGTNVTGPTCFDGVQNGNETGVDCGGPDCDPCPQLPTSPAPTPPNRAPEDVVSFYSNAYSNISNFDIELFGTTTLTDEQVAGDDIYALDGPAGGGFQYNFFATGSSVDLSGMTHYHVDIWVDGSVVGGEVFTAQALNYDGANNVESNNFYQAAATPAGQWISVDVPLASWANASGNTNYDNIRLLQIILQGPEYGPVYFDNLYFHNNTTLSSDEFELSEVNVYPNPTNNNWNIKTNNSTINSIQVFDLLGKQVLNLTPNSSEPLIDASGLNNGIYFAKVSTDLGTKSIKLIKN